MSNPQEHDNSGFKSLKSVEGQRKTNLFLVWPTKLKAVLYL